jgi:hypothetical protein
MTKHTPTISRAEARRLKRDLREQTILAILMLWTVGFGLSFMITGIVMNLWFAVITFLTFVALFTWANWMETR